MKTAEQLRNSVRFELGNPSREAVEDSVIDERVDDSYAEVLTRYRHVELEDTHEFTTSDGTERYSLPNDYWYSQVVKDETNRRPLVYRRINWIEAQDTTVDGDPQYYTRHGSELVLYPTPNGAYDIKVFYVKRAAPLLGDGTTVFDGIEWDEVVKWGAVWRVFNALGQQDRMIHARNIWRTLVNSLPELETLENERSVSITGAMQDVPIPGYKSGPTR